MLNLTKYENIDNDNISVDSVNDLLSSALNLNCSDIHIRPYENNVEIFYRINGLFYSQCSISTSLYSKLCGRLKVLASLPVYKCKNPLEGRIEYNKNDIRISFFPTINGENIVMRLFRSNEIIPDINKLFINTNSSELIKYLDNAQGLILFCGPTGSGKTTSLYSCLNYLQKEHGNSLSFATLEDPVEKKIKGIAQSEICNKTGFDFSNGLKFLLRQDINCIMIGEIRDEQTAKIAIQASMTGHLILSTLHTDSVFDAPYRLSEIGIDEKFISIGLKYIIAQRLIRIPCNCKNNKLCEKCFGTGYNKRTAISEFLSFNKTFSNIFMKSSTPHEFRNSVKKIGIKTFSEYGEDCLNNNITTKEEIQRVLGNIKEEL